VLATIVYSGVGTWVVVKALGAVTALRASSREEGLGLDVTQHGEEAYSRLEGAVLVQPREPDASAATSPVFAAESRIVGGAGI